jgi:hypothetical protein
MSFQCLRERQDGSMARALGDVKGKAAQVLPAVGTEPVT